MKKLLLLLPLIVCLMSCEENSELNTLEELIPGEWIRAGNQDTLIVMTKVNRLPGNEYGIIFLENGGLKEVKNVGWCGTPPITYGEFEGSWEVSPDSILLIGSKYWGGDMSMSWKIVKIDNDEMTYYLQDTYYEYFNP